MNIPEFLFLKKFTYKDFAKMLGINKQYLWSVANGYANPSPSMAGRISIASEGLIKIGEVRTCNANCLPGCECSKKE